MHDAGDAAAGPTTLRIFDLPPLFDSGGTVPRVWAAAAGGSGWRRCGVASSVDSGDSHATVGEIGGASPMGVSSTALESGCDNRWDRRSFEVMLGSDAMLLESRSEAAVLAEANLAAIGTEIVQFAQAELIAPMKYRLSNLLRGRRGSIAAAHSPGTRFVLLDPLRLLAIDLPGELLGRALRFRAVGAGDAATPAVGLTLGGNALRPLAPVFLRVVQADGDARFTWRRRSRSGFGWLDGTDAPLGELREAYRVTLSSGGTIRREASLNAAFWDYPATARAADDIAPGMTVTLNVAQIGDTTGPGTLASAAFILN